MTPRRISTIQDCSTYSWQIHSHDYATAHDAKIIAARVYTTVAAVMVKQQKVTGRWAVFYWDRRESERANH